MVKLKKDNLGDRMKGYEQASKTQLTKRLPVIIRLDGKAFHTFTKGLNKPFDDVLTRTMWQTAKYLCENIQGCKLAYTQSDEISLLLVNYENLDTSAWFNNNIQKMVSTSASMATLAFNRQFRENAGEFKINSIQGVEYKELLKYKFDCAMFDSRVFILPKEEVNNYFLWRQNDAVRNSVQMLAQSKFTHKELHGKNNEIVKDMLIEIGVDWDDLPTINKAGTCLNRIVREIPDTDYSRAFWEPDLDIPSFAEQIQYVESYVYGKLHL